MKASHVAVVLVVLSVTGVVFLTGVPEAPSTKPPRVEARRIDPVAEKAAEAPPFPPLEGQLWDLPSVDARLRVPKNWSIGSVQGDERLLLNEADLLDGNMNLVLMPNMFAFSLEELLQENLDELAVNPDLHLEDRREIYVMGRKVLRFDYNGTPRNGTEAVRFITVMWTRGKYQVVLCTTVRAAKWGEVAADVDAALDTLQIRWPIKK